MSTIKGFRAQLAMVPTTVERSHIESVVHSFMATYPARDVDTRVSLFADEVRFDDPAGLQFASDKAQVRKFFEDTIDRGYSIHFFPERTIVSGDEAIQIARVLLRVGDTDPLLLLLHLHFVFNSDGLITQLRTFFDQSCGTSPAGSTA